jgi:hypothetical protein
MRQILVVANRTLGGERLKEVVRERIGQGPCTFTLVVPVVLDAGDVIAKVGAADAAADSGAHWGLPSTTYESARIQAVRQLSAGIQALSELGASVDGDIGEQDPVKAVGHCVAAGTYEEIIVSTLPKTVSRWLLQDVPHRIQRKFKIPVTTVTAREGFTT